jgi:hypothetical protein
MRKYLFGTPHDGDIVESKNTSHSSNLSCRPQGATLQTPIPTSALLAFWLNAWNRGVITESDAINALEATAQLGLQLPVDMEYAIALSDSVILSRELVLTETSTTGWHYVDRNNTVAIPDPAFARQEFLAALSQSTEALTELDLIGSREEIDQALDDLDHLHLPYISERDFTTFHNAVRTRVAAHYARTHSLAVASPSQDQQRIRILTKLEVTCVDLMCAIASTA